MKTKDKPEWAPISYPESELTQGTLLTIPFFNHSSKHIYSMNSRTHGSK